MGKLTCVELCTGGGGTALGLEKAGFEHLVLVERDKTACHTLRLNRPGWNVLEVPLEVFQDIADHYQGADLLSAGIPCPPFSDGGKKLGEEDERNLFPAVLRIVKIIQPRAVMIENVSGLMDSQFAAYRKRIERSYRSQGYEVEWRILNASDYGVPQLRPRVVMAAIKKEWWGQFEWPVPGKDAPPTVGKVLKSMMAENGWEGAHEWAAGAAEIAPTLVGGSEKHGGPDLGPSRARASWAKLGVNGGKLGNEPPHPGFEGKPHLTVEMTACLQGFPAEWKFAGGKTRAYRQVGNAFPPPVAEAVAQQIRLALSRRRKRAPGRKAAA